MMKMATMEAAKTNRKTATEVPPSEPKSCRARLWKAIANPRIPTTLIQAAGRMAG